jgi:hypothetical protein
MHPHSMLRVWWWRQQERNRPHNETLAAIYPSVFINISPQHFSTFLHSSHTRMSVQCCVFFTYFDFCKLLCLRQLCFRQLYIPCLSYNLKFRYRLHKSLGENLYYTEASERSFIGLVVSALASGSQVRRFKPGRSCRIFRAKKSSACFPSEGK